MLSLSLSPIDMLAFFRKLSIGGKVKDGLLPEGVMGTAEDLLAVKNQSTLILQTDTELKESVYGKFFLSLSLYLCIVELFEYCRRHYVRETLHDPTFSLHLLKHPVIAERLNMSKYRNLMLLE